MVFLCRLFSFPADIPSLFLFLSLSLSGRFSSFDSVPLNYVDAFEARYRTPMPLLSRFFSDNRIDSTHLSRWKKQSMTKVRLHNVDHS